MKAFLHSLVEYLSCNKAERRGIFSLVVILHLVLVFNLALPWLAGRWKSQMDEDERIKLQRFIESVRDADPAGRSDASYGRSVIPFPFNPNTVNHDELKSMGLEDKLISRWIHYREKGGKFRSSADVMRLYGMSRENFERLEPYMTFQEEVHPNVRQAIKPVAKPVRIEINQADSMQLLSIPGIGPVFASRIIRYRDLLGGFLSTGQLIEVFGMDSIRMNKLLPSLYVDPAPVKKLSLSGSDFRLLARHPYVGYEKVKKINKLIRSGIMPKADSSLVQYGIFSKEEYKKAEGYFID